MTAAGGVAELRAQRLLAQRAARLAARQAAGSSQRGTADPAGETVLACRIGAETYGLPLTALAGVVPFAGCAPPLLAQPGVLGILARAGRLFSVVEAAAALGLATGSTEGGHLLLMRDASRIALRVDRAQGLVVVVAPGGGEAATPSHSGLVRYATIRREKAEASAETMLGLIDPVRLLLSFTALPSLPGV